MKIEPGNHIANQDRQKQPLSKASGAGEFQKILQQTFQGRQPQASGVSTVQAALNTGAAVGTSAVSGKTMVMLDRLSGVLDSLERYRLCLADPGCSLKKAASLLGQASEEVQQLRQDSSFIASDSRLDDLVQEVESTIAMEEARFRRGDYL